MINILLPYKSFVDREIQKKVDSWKDRTILRDACEYVVRNGGKRFRPALVMMVAEALGKGHNVIEAAMAIEFFHSASLVADDLPCMDDEDKRRDCPTVHKLYGEATAILVTYSLIGAGYESIARNATLVPNGEKVCSEVVQNVAYNAGLHGAAGGQFLDLYPSDLSLDTVKEVIRKKTVTLFEIAFVLGWLFGGGDIEKTHWIKKAADHFGIAFQIADDFGDEEQDFSNQRQVNLVGILGKESAFKMFHVELESYRQLLKDLSLNSEKLLSIADHLETHLLQIRATN